MFQDVDFPCNLEHVLNLDTIIDETEWDLNFTNNLLASSSSSGFFETAFDFMENGE